MRPTICRRGTLDEGLGIAIVPLDRDRLGTLLHGVLAVVLHAPVCRGGGVDLWCRRV